MSVMERARAHFREQMTAVNSVEVPEWGDSSGPLRIYYRPMSLKERDQIFRFVSKDSLESLVETLIVRARDEDGKKIFRPADRNELMREVDPDVIGRIVAEMGDEPTVEDAEKN